MPDEDGAAQSSAGAGPGQHKRGGVVEICAAEGVGRGSDKYRDGNRKRKRSHNDNYEDYRNFEDSILGEFRRHYATK